MKQTTGAIGLETQNLEQKDGAIAPGTRTEVEPENWTGG
jgi:hypothetical protein